jgi:hypothetical protein
MHADPHCPSSKLRQLLYVGAWRFLVWISRKQHFDGFLIVDISGTQSKFGHRFQNDVKYVLGQNDARPRESVSVLKRHVRTIARADIQDSGEYYAITGLLLLRVDYGSPDYSPQGVIQDTLVFFADRFRRQEQSANP